MKKIHLIIAILIFISCNRKKNELTSMQKINQILESNIDLEEKYDSIYNSGFLNDVKLTDEERIKIGNNFFSISSDINSIAPAKNIEVLPNKNLALYIRGHLKSKFKNRKFDSYRFNVFTNISIGKKRFTSGQFFEYDNYNFEELNFELHHKLINDIQAMNGKTSFVWLDESYLKHKPSSCNYKIEVIAENKVGEICRVSLYSDDFSNLWEENSPYLYYRK